MDSCVRKNDKYRFFAEFTLEHSEVLRMTRIQHRGLSAGGGIKNPITNSLIHYLIYVFLPVRHPRKKGICFTRYEIMPFCLFYFVKSVKSVKSVVDLCLTVLKGAHNITAGNY